MTRLLRNARLLAFAAVVILCLATAQQPWQKLQMPTAADSGEAFGMLKPRPTRPFSPREKRGRKGEKLYDGHITAAHALIFARLRSPDQQELLSQLNFMP